MVYRPNLYYSNTADCIESPSVFLAGPTVRDSRTITEWRIWACKFIDPQIHVIIPEPADMSDGHIPNKDYWWPIWTDQIDWEIRNLKSATAILFWIPRIMKDMPGLTTNIEFGMCTEMRPYSTFVGYPPNAEKNRYIDYVYNCKTGRKCVDNLPDLCNEINKFLLK